MKFICTNPECPNSRKPGFSSDGQVVVDDGIMYVSCPECGWESSTEQNS